MERLHERLIITEKALTKFEEVMSIQYPSSVERDASILRFKFTFEAVWKAAKQMIYDIEGADVGSPKGVIRSCREVGVFDQTETVYALKMVDDRNLTVHTYNEALAEEIYERLQQHLDLLKIWLGRVRERTTHDAS